LGLVIFHAISIIFVGVAVDKIVNAGATKVMYRGMSAGIIVAVLSMHAYDMSLDDWSYGPAIDGLNLFCLILLMLGSEVYHRVGLQESTFETTYPEVQSLVYDDE
jgi:peptidase E